MVNFKKRSILVKGAVLFLGLALLGCLLINFLQSDNSRFSDEGEVVIDHQLDLIWQSCAAGQLPPDCRSSAVRYQWTGAKDYCRDLILDGYSSWRLPTEGELGSLFEYSRSGTGSISEFFLNNPTDYFWTADQDHQGRATIVSLSDDQTETSYLDRYFYVRCVHDHF